MYFSFVVLTTLGFGDLTPATDGGKAVVAFEALLGQLFLVTVVSRLVSLYTGTKRSRAAAYRRVVPAPGATAGAAARRVTVSGCASVTPSSSPTAAAPGGQDPPAGAGRAAPGRAARRSRRAGP